MLMLLNIPGAVLVALIWAVLLATVPLPFFPLVAIEYGPLDAWDIYGQYFDQWYGRLLLITTVICFSILPFRIGARDEGALQVLLRDIPVPDEPMRLDPKRLKGRLGRWLYYFNSNLIQTYWIYLIKRRQMEEGRGAHWPEPLVESFYDYIIIYHQESWTHFKSQLDWLGETQVSGHYRRGHIRHTAHGIQHVRGHQVSSHTRRR